MAVAVVVGPVVVFDVGEVQLEVHLLAEHSVINLLEANQARWYEY